MDFEVADRIASSLNGVSWMREYLDLVRTVMEHGLRKPSRTGVDTLA